jgi:hypothetical protein
MATRGNLTDEKFKDMTVALSSEYPEQRQLDQNKETGIPWTSVSPLTSSSGQKSYTPSPVASTDMSEDLVLFRPLVEPGFQDMSYNERFFVNYCMFHLVHHHMKYSADCLSDEHRLCPSLALWHSDRDPYKALLQLFGSSKAILTTALAAAVCHYANSTMDKPLVTFAEGDSEYTCNVKTISLDAPADTASARLLEMYYTLKQKSLRLLAQAMEDPKTRAHMSTLATTMLLLVLEFLETGLKTWSIHLEGAKRLIELASSSGRLDITNELDGITDGITEYDFRTACHRDTLLTYDTGLTLLVGRSCDRVYLLNVPPCNGQSNRTVQH